MDGELSEGKFVALSSFQRGIITTQKRQFYFCNITLIQLSMKIYKDEEEEENLEKLKMV